MIRRFAATAACVAGFAAGAGAQIVVLREAGSGIGPEILSAELAGPHSLVEPGPPPLVIRADSASNRTVIALGRTVVVEGTVHRDVLVVGADLYVHPGGRIEGRAIAIGGGVYESVLAHSGPVSAYRSFTYDVARIEGGYALSYRSLGGQTVAKPTFSLPGVQGIQPPAYDRTNGLSVPIAIAIAVPHSTLQIDPGVTYRSQLGRLDPSLAATADLARQATVRVDVERGTFTNEAWIWPDLVNSLEYLLVGDDARNYYRATRAEAVIPRRWDSATSTLEPYIGGRVERATSVRPDSNATGGPWAFINRQDRDDVLRPNPPIEPATIYSLFGGVEWNVSNQGVIARARVDEEVGTTHRLDQTLGPSEGALAAQGSSFAQTTFDGGIAFPTFGLQRLRVDGHAVLSLGSAPRQRWAYLGGPGTLPTLALLSRGGDQLVYVDFRYDIPVSRVVLPLVGSPIITLREALGGADTSAFPTVAQATGVRLSLSLFYVEFLVDPVTRTFFKGAGLSVAR